MPRVFIAYRREDSRWVSGRIYDALAARFGANNTFKDVYAIPPGADFRAYIGDKVSQCDVMLVIIGQQWLSMTDESGLRRLDNPADFARIEIEQALARNIPVIPVLVDGTRMPRAEELPASLVPLAYRQATLVRDPDFPSDVARLIESIASVNGAEHRSTVPTVGLGGVSPTTAVPPSIAPAATGDQTMPSKSPIASVPGGSLGRSRTWWTPMIPAVGICLLTGAVVFAEGTGQVNLLWGAALLALLAILLVGFPWLLRPMRTVLVTDRRRLGLTLTLAGSVLALGTLTWGHQARYLFYWGDGPRSVLAAWLILVPGAVILVTSLIMIRRSVPSRRGMGVLLGASAVGALSLLANGSVRPPYLVGDFFFFTSVNGDSALIGFIAAVVGAVIVWRIASPAVR